MLSKNMKARFDTFVDAILAIIITIMVLELPNTMTDGTALPLHKLVVSILVYGVSFCFVGSIWYQLARTFDEVDEMSKRMMLWVLVLIFIVSLIPNLTTTMVSDANNVTVTVYGGVVFISTLLLQYVSYKTLHQRYPDTVDFMQTYLSIYGSFARTTLFLIVVSLIVGWFYPQIAMVFYFVIPVRTFLTIDGEQSEIGYLSHMPASGRESFFKLDLKQKRQLRQLMRRYAVNKDFSIPAEQMTSDQWQAFITETSHALGLPEQTITAWFTTVP
ncbi:TMEM175 family protein [Lacticaseibacillus thailandensis]|uniref:Integral membrane protein n=1 Tax=Lacticaseibacillus thailandensis DSM 22698 = JCM 13996 TaxID=1423810 RepID=A0A0R2C724_9LACO|nr:TMEM175 family protein [Lacticaseibacillus thailandensis]KRM87565.1 integral membrane protein [Lacticaseibacillus thailandensis DSM 22698 = JCM 13996]